MTTLDPIYREPGSMTSAGKYRDFLRTLPRGVPAIARAIQGVQIHEYLAPLLYGLQVPEERKHESQIRRLDHMLASMHARDPRPLAVARAPEERAVGVCRHFTVLFIAALRDQGIPARARVGFGSWFNPPQFEDHWLCEYWNEKLQRWILADAQLDETQRKAMSIDFDPLDVPRNKFVIAHAAWQRARNGEIDAKRYGFSPAGLTGLWFIAGGLIRDAAALNGAEMLPWDVWGGMPKMNAELTADELTFFDHLAQLTAAPDEHAKELRTLYETDTRLRPDVSVWNDIKQASEKIDEPPPGVRLE
ncbi:MAG TPA: transglutaminase domain-containing protein [Polyangiales bacterium]|nr:transglutaminase domain-containing protein [Polyangiales bacterium]